MLSKTPDSAARGFMFACVVWLAIGAAALSVAAAQLVSPSFLGVRGLSFGRMSAIGSIALQYGWLTLAGFATIFYCLPRLTGVRMVSEAGGHVAGAIVNLVVVLAMLATMFGGVSGPQLSELPVWLVVPFLLALAMVAGNVIATVARKTEPKMYVSVWCFIGASVWGPLSLAAGRLHPFTGADEAIASMFSTNAFTLLWFGAIGMGGLYYVVPRASGEPLYSHGLALFGLWTLAFAAPLSAESKRVFGVTQGWLQSLGTAAAIMLLIPAAAVAINFFGTLRRSWSRVPDHPSLRYFAGGTVIWVIALVWGALQALRSVAEVVGLSEWISGQTTVLIAGAFTLWSAGLIAYASPRLIGRRWVNRTALTAGFWLTSGAAGAIAIASVGAGLVAGAVLFASAAAGRPASTLPDFALVNAATEKFRMIGLAGASMFLAGAVIFMLSLFRSATSGEPHPIEVVASEEVLV